MERESSLEERQRKDKEKADAVRERQIRLGHVPSSKTEEKSKAKSGKKK